MTLFEEKVCDFWIGQGFKYFTIFILLIANCFFFTIIVSTTSLNNRKLNVPMIMFKNREWFHFWLRDAVRTACLIQLKAISWTAAVFIKIQISVFRNCSFFIARLRTSFVQIRRRNFSAICHYSHRFPNLWIAVMEFTNRLPLSFLSNTPVYWAGLSEAIYQFNWQ